MSIGFILVVIHILNTVYVGGYQNYPKMFEKLKQGNFKNQTVLSKNIWKRLGGQVKTWDGDVTWFSKFGSFKIQPYGHVFGWVFARLDPVAYYWFSKLRTYAQNNIDHQYLSEEDV